MADPGLLCRCSVCGREERAGGSPLRNGWPTCCGYTMTLIDGQQRLNGVLAATGSEPDAATSLGSGAGGESESSSSSGSEQHPEGGE